MKKRILVGAVAILSVATLVFASNDYKQGHKNGEYYKKSMYSKCSHKKMGDFHKSFSKYGKFSHSRRAYSHDMMFMKMFRALNLTPEQRKSIRNIMMESRKSYKNAFKRTPFSQYFENGNFNKDKYVQDAKKRASSMIEKRAETMSKIFAVLDKKQKNDFLILLKAKEIQMNAKREYMMKMKKGMKDKKCPKKGQ